MFTSGRKRRLEDCTGAPAAKRRKLSSLISTSTGADGRRLSPPQSRPQNIRKVKCVCASESDQRVMVRCDSCENWLHYFCLVSNKPKTENEAWTCPRCLQAERENVANESTVLKDITTSTMNSQTREKLTSQRTSDNKETPESRRLMADFLASDAESDDSEATIVEGSDQLCADVSRLRVNPDKMELDASDDDDHNMEEVVVDVERATDEIETSPEIRALLKHAPTELQQVDREWISNLTWAEIENISRDHDDLNLPPINNDYFILEDTGEVDEKQCGVFNLKEFEPESKKNFEDKSIHVWQSTAKVKREAVFEEPLGNFRGDYNGTTRRSGDLVRLSLGTLSTYVYPHVVSPLRFDAEGDPRVHVTLSDWTWLTYIKSDLAAYRDKLEVTNTVLTRTVKKIAEFKTDPTFPFQPTMPNPAYDANKAMLWRTANPNLPDYYAPNNCRRTISNQKYRDYERAVRINKEQKLEKVKEEQKIQLYEGSIQSPWYEVTTSYDDWVKIEDLHGSREDLFEYFDSELNRKVKTLQQTRFHKKLQKFNEHRATRSLLSKKSTLNKTEGKRVQRAIQRMDAILWNTPQTSRNQHDFLFTSKIHNVTVMIKTVLLEVVPFVPDDIIHVISDFAEEDLFIKDIAINPSVLMEKYRDGLPEKERFLLPYILATNRPKYETLVEKREELFYQKSNIPMIALQLMENLGEEGQREMMETDLRCVKSKLFKYQTRSYVWMDNLEQKILRKHRWIFGANDMYIDSQSPNFDGESTRWPILLDHIEQRVSIVSPEFQRTPSRYVTVSGGVLADEVGLGKTLTTICLLFGNRPTYALTRALNCVKTTLIIAPSHLIHQWRDEITKHTTGNCNILEVPTKPKYMKVTAKQLFNTDVLLVSTQFLKGKFYSEYRLCHKPWLETTKFWRVVVDEGHELVAKGNERVKHNALNMIGVNYWYLSGTPFPTPSALAFCCKFIRMRVCDRPVNETEFLFRSAVGPILEKVLVDHIVMRNTKVSVEELHVPTRIETPAFIDLHPVEFGFYEICRKYYPQEARQICADISSVEGYKIDSLSAQAQSSLIESGSLACGLNLLPDSLARDRREQLPRQRGIVARIEDAIAYEQRREKPDKIFLRTKQRDLCAEKRKLTRMEREIKFCESMKLKNDLRAWEIANRENPLRYATLLLGSKFSTAVLWIANLVKTNPSARIIAFSNFTKVLRNYHRYLCEVMKVKAVFCMGNVYVRRKAMRSFESDDPDPVRVILLSIQKSASGANLTRATHVCLLDPVAASASQAVAAEEQAVGRALRQGMSRERHCQIIRFVAKGTIEQELFERNQVQRQKNEGAL